MTKFKLAGDMRPFFFIALAISLLSTASLPGWAAELELRVVPQFAGKDIRLDAADYLLETGEKVSFSRVSYLLSGFALENAQGSWLEMGDLTGWLDAATHRESLILADLPQGEYRRLRFHIGLDQAANEHDPAGLPAANPLNPTLNGLHWSWQGGYIFFALEGLWSQGKEPPQGYSWHFARHPNRTEISLALPTAFNLTASHRLDMALDLAAVLQPPLSMAKLGNSTHSRDGDPIAAAMKAHFPAAFKILGQKQVPQAQKPAKPLPKWLPKTITPWPFTMSRRFNIPALPPDNPLLTERVTLGKRLFFDPLLSKNDKISCASCHEPRQAFSDSRQFSLGISETPTPRHAMPLFNLAWKSSFFWDGRAASLRDQVLQPIQDVHEMGETLPHLEEKLRKAPEYPAQFAKAFGSDEISAERLAFALENFLLTLTSHDSKFDRAMNGEGELTEPEKRGFELFFTEYEPRSGRLGADCFHCHGGANFSDHGFHNNGLDAIRKDLGLEKVTKQTTDRARFSTPSLRNVGLTAPYMHDGRFATLSQVVEHYASGVKRSATLDPNLAKHPEGIPLTKEDKDALVAFLNSLTDPQFLR